MFSSKYKFHTLYTTFAMLLAQYYVQKYQEQDMSFPEFPSGLKSG